MSKETQHRIHQVYDIALSAVTVLAGLCFIVATYNVYQTGLAQDVQPYTPETIAAAFSKIALPVYLCLAFVIGGWILDLAMPREKKKLPPEKNLPLILKRLQVKTDLEQCDTALRNAVLAQSRRRRRYSFICGLLVGLFGVFFLAYACNPVHWITLDPTTSMRNAVLVLLSCMAVPLAFAIFMAYAGKRSLNAEIELMRQASTVAPKKPDSPAPSKKLPWTAIVRYGVLILAVAMIVYGYCSGGTAAVLTKAVNICTECVGLG